MSAIEGYGDVNPIVAPYGHGGMRNFIIDDTFGDDMPFPYYNQIIEVKKTGPGVHTFYMPPAGQIQCGSCSHFVYANGNVDIVFGIQPGGDPAVIINGANAPITFKGHGFSELFYISAEKSGWRVWKFNEPQGTVKSFGSFYLFPGPLIISHIDTSAFEIDSPAGWTFWISNNFSNPSKNRLQYDGTVPKVFRIEFLASNNLQYNAVQSPQVITELRVNNNPVVPACLFSRNNDELGSYVRANLYTSGIVELNPGDYVSLWLAGSIDYQILRPSITVSEL
jgi:hypothetical protein